MPECSPAIDVPEPIGGPCMVEGHGQLPVKLKPETRTTALPVASSGQPWGFKLPKRP